MRASWKEKRIDVYIAAVIIPSVILSVLALWLLSRQQQFIHYAISAKSAPLAADGLALGFFSRASVFAFSMIIFSLLLILLLGSYLSAQNLERQKELNRLKSEFISAVSHEIKTPLTSIRLLAERLLKFVPEEAAKQNPDLHYTIEPPIGKIPESYHFTNPDKEGAVVRIYFDTLRGAGTNYSSVNTTGECR